MYLVLVSNRSAGAYATNALRERDRLIFYSGRVSLNLIYAFYQAVLTGYNAFDLLKVNSYVVVKCNISPYRP